MDKRVIATPTIVQLSQNQKHNCNMAATRSAWAAISLGVIFLDTYDELGYDPRV